jgi:phage shock protein A
MAGRPNWPANSPTEVTKLQQHLALLKKEYVKLQNHCSELEKKFSITNARDKSEDSFVSRLLQTVAGLYSQKQYR